MKKAKPNNLHCYAPIKKGRKHWDSNREEVSLLVDQTLKTVVETTGGKLKDDKKKSSSFDANVTEQGQILEIVGLVTLS